MTERPEPERMAYTVNEFCALVRIGRTLFYRLVKENKLPIVKVGYATRVPVAVLAHILAHTSSADLGAQPRTAAHKLAMISPANIDINWGSRVQERTVENTMRSDKASSGMH